MPRSKYTVFFYCFAFPCWAGKKRRRECRREESGRGKEKQGEKDRCHVGILAWREDVGVEVIGMRKGKVKQRLLMYTCTY